MCDVRKTSYMARIINNRIMGLARRLEPPSTDPMLWRSLEEIR